MNTRDPYNMTHWQPGDRLAVFASHEPFRIATTKGEIVVPVARYGRFVMTSEGWAVADEG